jgi:hypothetical protein
MYDPSRRELSAVGKDKRISPIGGAEEAASQSEPSTSRRQRRQPMASEESPMKLTGIELKRAQLVPSAMFTSPDAVVRSQALSLPQKIAILRRWEFDVRQGGDAGRPLAVSAERRLLHAVRGALADLGAPAEAPARPRPRLATH